MQIILFILALILSIISWQLWKVSPNILRDLLADPDHFARISKPFAILFYLYAVLYLVSIFFFQATFIAILTVLTSVTSAIFSILLAKSMKRLK